MEYELSLLHCKRGNILFRMGRYHESIEAFNEALRNKVDHRYFYNKAVVFHRLGQFVYAERAFQQAIDCLKGADEKDIKDSLKEYEDYLSSLKSREKPLIWWEWWLSEGTKRRKFLGIILLAWLMIAVFVPLLVVPLGIILQWLCVEQWVGWSEWLVWYLVPIIILLIFLLSPGIRSIGSQGLEMDTTMLRRGEISFEIREKPIEPYISYVKSRKNQ